MTQPRATTISARGPQPDTIDSTVSAEAAKPVAEEDTRYLAARLAAWLVDVALSATPQQTVDDAA